MASRTGGARPRTRWRRGSVAWPQSSVAAARRHVGGLAAVPQFAEFEMFFPRDAHAVHEVPTINYNFPHEGIHQMPVSDRISTAARLLHRRHMKALRPRDLLVTVDAAASLRHSLVAASPYPVTGRISPCPGGGGGWCFCSTAAEAGSSAPALFHRTCACPRVRVSARPRVGAFCVSRRGGHPRAAACCVALWGRGTTGSDAGPGAAASVYPQLRAGMAVISRRACSPSLAFANKDPPCTQRKCLITHEHTTAKFGVAFSFSNSIKFRRLGVA